MVRSWGLCPVRLSGSGIVVQNFNDMDVSVSVTIPIEAPGPRRCVDRLSGKPISSSVTESDTELVLSVPLAARGRAWVQEANRELPSR